jgi:hypothetical protein
MVGVRGARVRVEVFLRSESANPTASRYPAYLRRHGSCSSPRMGCDNSVLQQGGGVGVGVDVCGGEQT